MENKTLVSDVKKDISFELMRSLACFFVIAIHVYSGLFSIPNKVYLKTWLQSDIAMSVSRFAVPLFIMITGALLLKKDVNIKTALNKAGKMLLILTVWSIAYVVISNIYISKESYSIQEVIVMFLSNKISYHLWYLYMIIGIYVTLPFITKLIKSIDIKIQKFYIIIFLLVSAMNLVPLVAQTYFDKQLKFYFMIPLMDWQLGCLIIGFFISNLVINKKTFYISILGFFALNIFTITSTYLLSMKNKSGMQDFHSNNNINTILLAACVFIISKYISKYISEKSLLSKLIVFLGSISFEIYLIHPMVLTYYQKNIVKLFIEFLPPARVGLKFFIDWIIVSIISLFLAYLINFTTRKLKIVTNRLLYKNITA